MKQMSAHFQTCHFETSQNRLIWQGGRKKKTTNTLFEENRIVLFKLMKDEVML